MKEKEIENQIKKYLKEKNIYYFKVHGAMFQRSGIPDIIACHKGKFIALEVKRPGGVESELQKINIRDITNNGGIAHVVYSLEEVKKIIETI